jgi:hypothetical protein
MSLGLRPVGAYAPEGTKEESPKPPITSLTTLIYNHQTKLLGGIPGKTTTLEISWLVGKEKSRLLITFPIFKVSL